MRILFLTHRLPYAPNRGDRIRSHFLLRLLSLDHEVHVVSLVHDRQEAAHVPDLRQLVASVHPVPVPRIRNLFAAAAALPGPRPLTHVLLDAPRMSEVLEACVAAVQPDVVIAHCTGIARFALEPPLSRIPYVLDLVDVDSEKWAMLGSALHGPKAWIARREATRLRRFEQLAISRAQAAVVVSERERELVEQLFPGSSALVVPIGVDVAALTPPGPPTASPRVVFSGVFAYEPNEHGARWFASEVWPLIRESRPDAQLTLVGQKPTRAVRRLSRDPSIEVTGEVPDVRPYLWNAALAIAPVFLSRGVQTKVLEAVAARLPCVVTDDVMGGLPDAVRRACFAASRPADFARHVVDLLGRAPRDRRQLAESAFPDALSWDQISRPFLKLFDAAAAV